MKARAPFRTHQPPTPLCHVWPGRVAGCCAQWNSSLRCRVVRAGPQPGTSLLFPWGPVLRTGIWVWAQLAQPQPCAQPQLASILSIRIWNPGSFHSKLLHVSLSSYHSSVLLSCVRPWIFQASVLEWVAISFSKLCVVLSSKPQEEEELWQKAGFRYSCGR